MPQRAIVGRAALDCDSRLPDYGAMPLNVELYPVHLLFYITG